MTNVAQQVYDRLFRTWGSQHWWPADTPFEVMIGAVLVQNTSWRNVVRVIENLKNVGRLSPHDVLALEFEALQELIRPAGYFRVKARRLQALVRFFVEEYDGDIVGMQATEMSVLREKLLSVHGIGPETADSILLYAVGHPALVVDTYTQRVFSRHGWVPQGISYHALQDHLMREMPVDTSIYKEFHALMVQLGKNHCRKTPQCEGCPLQPMLPASGVVCE